MRTCASQADMPPTTDAGGAACPPAAAGGGAAGSMGESVTPHAPITGPDARGPRDWQFLIAGFDTLDLGVYVDWPHDAYEPLIKNLSALKAEAAGRDAVLWRETPVGDCLVHAGGKGSNYKYHLQLPDLHLFLAAQDKPKKHPNVYASPGARMLWRNGATQTAEILVQLIRELGGSVDRVQVSRVDLAADFLLPEGLSLDFVRGSLVSKSRATNHWEDGGRLQTFYVGKKSAPVQARIYDKLLKALSDPSQAYFAELWRPREPGPIWRVEFQLRRSVLRQLGIQGVEDLVEKAGGLWSYLTGDWMSLRLDDNVNTKRRTVHPWWRAVQDCSSCFGPSCDISREMSDATRAPVEWYVAHIAGCLATYAARVGAPEIGEALVRLWDQLAEYWGMRDWGTEYLKRRIKLGLAGEGSEVPDAPF